MFFPNPYYLTAWRNELELNNESVSRKNHAEAYQKIVKTLYCQML